MPLTVVPGPLFLPLEAVKLGRFVRDINQPLEGYHEPPSLKTPTSIVTEYDYAANEQHGAKVAFGSALTSLLSGAFSKRSASEVRITPKRCKSYTLDNSDAWFDEAISSEETKRWIEKAALRGRKIFMIVGMHTLIDTQFFESSMTGHQLQGQATAPVSLSLAAAGAIVPFAGLIDPSVHAESQRSAGSRARLFAPGELICAVQYRVISYGWRSSRNAANLRVSGTRTWSCMEGGRRDAYTDETEDDEDVVEVDVKDEEELGKGWDAQESEQGQVYIHS
ncbi:hypothetical protein Q7P35_002213 [Cladosporium inversicolor]